jgi:AcrR family transcriptional regulator
VRNVILDRPNLVDSLAERAVGERRDRYADEVRRLVDAAYEVMRAAGDLDPRVADVVRTAGLSNQAFYRHFASKDALLLAVLTDGQERLLATLTTRMERVGPGAPAVAAWIEGVMAQARNREAAENTRPFAVHGRRLADRFPDEWARSRAALVAPLRAALAEAGADPDRAPDISHLAMGHMEDALTLRHRPTATEVDAIVDFAMKGAGLVRT